jgi:hypothetical protein
MIIEMQYYDFICRNKTGELVIFENQVFEPHKIDNIWIGNEWWINNQAMWEVGKPITDEYLLKEYEYLTWEDIPIKITKI